MKARLRFKRPQLEAEAVEVDATDAAWALARDEKGNGAEAFLMALDGTGKNGRVTVGDVRATLARE
jgi:hypothetical protein